MKVINFEKLLPADIPPGERILWHGRPEHDATPFRVPHRPAH